MSTNLEAALYYAQRLGWRVFPLKPGDKRPAVIDWPNVATTDPEQIRRWWAQMPAANIGLACGDLLAVDLDQKDGRDGLLTWAALQLEADTVTSRTPSGGLHLLYKMPPGAELGNTAGKLGEGIDTRGQGGYIVLPPSILGNGSAYEWQIKPTDREPADLPAELVSLLTTAPREIPITRPPTVATNAEPYARAALEAELDAVARTPEGNRNQQLNQAAFSLGQLVGAVALDRHGVEAQLLAVALTIGLGEREALATIKSGLDAGEREPRIIPPPTVASSPPPAAAPEPAPETEPNGGDFKLSDLGNAERLAHRYGDRLLWCDPWACWLAWDGRRWARDDTCQVEAWASETVRAIPQEAKNKPDEEYAKIMKWAGTSENHYRRQAMIKSARPYLAILPEALDADPWLLTCNNGTVDLRTGELRPHNPGDLITKLAPVDYDPRATAPTWAAFLARIMRDNQDLISFLQRAAGYSLTGNTQEQCFFLLHGTGANGKSTYLEALSDLLVDYSKKTSVKTVLVKRGDGIPEDIARLKGARLVTAVEAEEGQRLAESLIKELTGGDTIAARYLYGRTFEFKPEFKLWLATNHKPAIRGTDNAIWRRIRLVPFEVSIPPAEQDKTLPEKLRAELRGILAWAVHGCLEWQAAGLGEPPEVKAATAAYQAEQDVLGGWLADCCHESPTAQGQASQLYASYKEWCQDNGERAMSGRKFGQRLIERGFDKYRDKAGIQYIGLGLAAQEDCSPLPV